MPSTGEYWPGAAHPGDITHNTHWTAALYRDFPGKIARSKRALAGPLFEKHWHEALQILHCEQGEALIHCNGRLNRLAPGDTLVINSQELHYGVTESDHLIYVILKIDLPFLASSQQDLCQLNYLTPLAQGTLLFQNKLPPDPALSQRIQTITEEYQHLQPGWELAIKAQLYLLLVHLLRHYRQEALPPAELQRQQHSLAQLRAALEYVDTHYQETIRLSQLAALANLSEQHFCRLFKTLTGKRPMDYINYIRTTKAVTLLTEDRLSITEIAAAVGFDDSNYFSRVFKKYQNRAPSELRKKQTGHDVLPSHPVE